MRSARQVVALALEARASAGIKVRQPLAQLKVNSKKYSFDSGFMELIKEEVNVKDMALVDSFGDEKSVELDANITPELMSEGQAREFIRSVQELRKRSNLNPHDVVCMTVETDEIGRRLISSFEPEIKKAAKISSLKYDKAEGDVVSIDEMHFKIAFQS